MADDAPPGSPPSWSMDGPDSPIDVAPLPFNPRSRYSEANEDSDILLVSSDDVNFHVSSIVLKLSSTVFRDMLSIPQPLDTSGDGAKVNGTHRKDSDAIRLSENAGVLCLLLDIIYPGRGLHLSKNEHGFFGMPMPIIKLKSVGLAAIKYDMVTALRSIRAFLVSEEAFGDYNAVELYGVAWDLELFDEAKRLSTETLKLNLNTLGNEESLENMNVAGVLKLQRLHRQRKIILLNSLSEMVDGKPYYAMTISKYGVNLSAGGGIYRPLFFVVPRELKPQHRMNNFEENYEWKLLVSEASRIMEECPDGSDFFRDGDDFFYDEKFAQLRSVSDFRKLSKEFRHIFAGLPKAIDV